VVVALIAYDRIAGDEPIAAIADSRSAAIFAEAQSSVEEQIPTEAPDWIMTALRAADRHLRGGIGRCAVPSRRHPPTSR
jgi:hypothetical protein